MNQQEALEKINEFQSIIASSNKVFIAPKTMLAIGIGLLFVPVLEWVTNYGTFGLEFSQSVYDWMPAIKGIFYGLVFYFLGSYFENSSEKKAHPLIKKAFSVQWSVVAGVVVMSIGLSLTKNSDLVYPAIFILLGIFYNLLGKFSHKSFSLVSWLYILAGPVFMFLLRFEISYLWVLMMVFHGLTCLYIAYSSNKSQEA